MNRRDKKTKGKDMKIQPTSSAGQNQVYNSIKTHLQHIGHHKEMSSEDIYKNYDFEHIHYPIIELGLKVNRGKITSHTVVATILLENMTEIVKKMEDNGRSFTKYMNEKISTCKKILAEFFKFDESIENIFSFLSHLNYNIKIDANFEQARNWFVEKIDDYIFQHLTNAKTLIIDGAISLIKENDHILITTHAPLLTRLVEMAMKKELKFSLYVVYDPNDEKGKEDCLTLSKLGAKVIMTSYNNIAYFMPIINKVFISGTAIYSNGYTLARSGTSIIALFAKKYRKPFYVLMNTFKFSDKNQIDSLMINKSNYDPKKPNEMVMLDHDLVPSKLISLLITEIGFMPPASVPVVLREFKYDYDSLEYRE